MTNKQNTVTVTMKENTEHKGLELYFDGKPSADILDSLKGNGWHWHNVKKCWYAKDTASSRQIANQLVKKPVKAASDPAQKEDKPVAKMNFSTAKRDSRLSRACLNSRLWPQKEAGCHCFIMPDSFRLRYWPLSYVLH